jgi:uncharacterized OsmC-like protein
MTQHDIATALKRVESILRRRPETGLHDDAPATARWQGGLRVVSEHGNGTRIESDMPTELGGSGDRITPGWLFRAGLAACTATCIGMHAAARGIALDSLDVQVGSRSDLRGVFGMTDGDGGPLVDAGPGAIRMTVRIAARGVAAEALRELVEHSERCSPIGRAASTVRPIALHIDVVEAA